MKLKDILWGVGMILFTCGLLVLVALYPMPANASVSSKEVLQKECERFQVTCVFDNFQVAEGADAHIYVTQRKAYFREWYYNANHAMVVFCHEMGHLVDFNKGLFKAGYWGWYKIYAKAKRVSIIIALERHADVTGFKICKTLYPHVNYYFAYGLPSEPVPEDTKKWIEDNE